MKKRYSKGVYLSILVIFAALYACEKNEEGSDSKIKKGEIAYSSGCKEHLKSTGTFSEAPCITVETTDSKYLIVKHNDAVFSCIFDHLNIDYSVNGNLIDIAEEQVNPDAFCTCKYDIEYVIGPLEYGTYTVKIRDGSLDDTEISFEFEFTENTLFNYCNE
jgi:hypothetical protein